MITQSPAVMRLPRKAFPLAAAALLLASLPLLAGQEFSRPDDSSDFGPTAPEVDSGSFDTPSAPSEPSVSSEPSPPSVSSEPSAPAEPSAPSEASAPNVPSEPGGSAEPSVPSTEELLPPIRIAQERSRPSDSSDAGRTAHEIGSHVSSSSGSSGGSSSSSGSDSGRTARPVGPGDNEPHRQPPSRGSSGGGGHHGGGHHGGGYYGGGYYYPYGYYGYGFWPFSSWWWGGWWGYGYPYYPYGYGYGQPGYYGHGEVGALDFDVSPARTEIYLDGQYVGKVDGFDGWPRYLWLPKGTYDVVLYLEGFRTIARQISVYPGSVISLDDRMEPGDSVRPEDLASKSHERRDERLSYERERRERLERGEPGDDDEEDWQDRVRRERGEWPYDHSVRDDEDEAEESVEQKGRLRLDVDPEDASVYLDGRFVGTGSELALMRGGLPVTAGEHKLAVVRPGRKAEERDFQVEAGEEVELEVNLEVDSR